MPIPGADYLAGAKYPSAIVAEHVRGGAAGIIHRTFGDAVPVVRLLCPIASEIVVHVAPFDYSHSYPIKKYLARVLSDAKKFERVAKNCNAVILLSPFCEHQHTTMTMARVFRRLRRVAPSTLMVSSSLNNIEVTGAITEIHIPSNGKLPAVPRSEYTVSYDGYPDFLTARSVLRKYRTARHVRWWVPQMNGKAYAAEKTPIAERFNWPTRELLRKGWARLINHLRGL
jgi:hypothetical protein